MSLEQMFDSLCKVSNTWDERDEITGARLALTVDKFLLNNATSFVSSHSQEPIALWFTSDCTEHRHKRTSLMKMGPYLVIRRLRDKHESLVQRLFLYDTKGDRAVVWSYPIADKTM